MSLIFDQEKRDVFNNTHERLRSNRVPHGLILVGFGLEGILARSKPVASPQEAFLDAFVTRGLISSWRTISSTFADAPFAFAKTRLDREIERRTEHAVKSFSEIGLELGQELNLSTPGSYFFGSAFAQRVFANDLMRTYKAIPFFCDGMEQYAIEEEAVADNKFREWAVTFVQGDNFTQVEGNNLLTWLGMLRKNGKSFGDNLFNKPLDMEKVFRTFQDFNNARTVLTQPSLESQQLAFEAEPESPMYTKIA